MTHARLSTRIAALSPALLAPAMAVALAGCGPTSGPVRTPGDMGTPVANAPTATTPLAGSSGDITAFGRALLREQNQARADVGVAPLRWNEALAGAAKDWANELARRGRIEHASAEVRGNQGENLWTGTAGRFGAEQMIEAFVSEKRYFRNDPMPDISTTGRWQDVGHYSQIVWRNTTDVGCAITRGGGNDYLVCRYSPSGNVIGQRAY